MIKPLLMPLARPGVSDCPAPPDLLQAFLQKLEVESDWAQQNQFLRVWLQPDPARVTAARATLLQWASGLAHGADDAFEHHTWCLAPRALRVAAFATWLEAIAPWPVREKETLGRDLVAFCRHHALAVLTGRVPSADNQYLSLSATCAIVGEGLLRLGVELRDGAWLADLGLENCRRWIGLMPPDGYSGEGSTYQLQVVGSLATWLCMLLVEREGARALHRPYAPNGTTLADILRLHGDLASPAGVAPGWDNHGWHANSVFSPAAYYSSLTGAPLPESWFRQRWDAGQNTAWGDDDRQWTLLCWPEPPVPAAPAPALSGWTRPHCAAVIDHAATRSRLMLCGDRTADAIQAVGRYQCNPNHVLYEIGGEAIFGDGGKLGGVALAHDEEGLRRRLEAPRLAAVLRQFGGISQFLRAVDVGLLGQANTVIVNGQREWFPFDAEAGQCIWERRAVDAHAATFDGRAVYDPGLPLRVARRTIAMDAAGVAWVVDDYRAVAACDWEWQVFLPPASRVQDDVAHVALQSGGAVTLGWPVGCVVSALPEPGFPKSFGLPGWVRDGSVRLARVSRGTALRTATVVLPFAADALRVHGEPDGSWSAQWAGGQSRILLPDLGDAPVVPTRCPVTMSGEEPAWRSDPAVGGESAAALLHELAHPAPESWRRTVLAMQQLAVRGEAAVAPVALALLRDPTQRYHVHSVACRVLGACRHQAAELDLRDWSWSPEPNIAVRARAALEHLGDHS